MTKFLWDFNQDAIDTAAKELGLRYPIYVTGKRGQIGNSNGHYEGIRFFNTAARISSKQIWDEPHHVIKVDRRSDYHSATKTIWHELQHAVQCERWIPADDPGNYPVANRLSDDEYMEAGGHDNGSKKSRERYEANWLEVEADEVADAHKHQSLVKLTKKGMDRQHFLAGHEDFQRDLQS